MDNYDWHELSLLDDIDDTGEVNERGQKSRVKNKASKSKWREIEAIKEQRRLQRDLATFEQCSF